MGGYGYIRGCFPLCFSSITDFLSSPHPFSLSVWIKRESTAHLNDYQATPPSHRFIQTRSIMATKLNLGSLNNDFAGANITQVVGISEIKCVLEPYFST